MACPVERLEALPQWSYRERALRRVYIGKTYLDALSMLNRVAELSEAADHHPDLMLEWKKLTIHYWTHTAKGVTTLDFELATQVENLLAAAEAG